MNEKVIKNTKNLGIVIFFIFIFLNNRGIPPIINPIKNIIVIASYFVKHISITLDKDMIDIIAPKINGNKKDIDLLNFLNILDIEDIKSSYIPIVKAIVPPLTPGIILAIPKTKPFKNINILSRTFFIILINY